MLAKYQLFIYNFWIGLGCVGLFLGFHIKHFGPSPVGSGFSLDGSSRVAYDQVYHWRFEVITAGSN